MSGTTRHIDNEDGAYKKVTKSLDEQIKLFEKLIDEIPKEEMDKIIAEVEAMNIEGPTPEEYFESIHPQLQYVKGYREGALRYKTLVENFLKEWVAEIRKKESEDINSPKYNAGSIEDLIESHILPKMQEIFDNN